MSKEKASPLTPEEQRTLFSPDDVGAFTEWLAARRASREEVDVTQLLHTAAGRGAAKIVKHLLDSGAKVDAKGKYGVTALMLAAEGMDPSPGRLACVECLLERGANPNARDRLGWTVLAHAFLEGEYATTPEALSLLERTVAALLRHGADASAPGAKDAVLTAARLKTTSPLRQLLDAGASASGPGRPSKLRDAQLEGLAHELGMAPELSGIDQEESTPLQAAIYAKSLAAVQLLLERGADAKALLTKGRTPLLYAVEVNAADLIPELVKQGADINAPEAKFGLTPLMWACREGGSPEVVQVLLHHGARIDDVLRIDAGGSLVIEGETPLAMAYKSQRRELIDVLLAHGARERGFLGVVLYPPTAGAADVRRRRKTDGGAVLANVFRDSAADVAGIQRDDAIIELDARQVASHDDLVRIMSSRLAGDRLRCIVVREGEQIELQMELHPSCRCQRKYPEPQRPVLGVAAYPPAELSDVRARLELDAGAIVADVVRDSAADLAGLQRDDAIIELEGHPIADHADLRRILSSKAAGDRLRCVVVRQGERIEVPVALQLGGSLQVVLRIERPSL